MSEDKSSPGLVHCSIGAAFLFACVVPLGSLFVEFVLSGPVLWEARGLARQLPGVRGNYWIPALFFYLVFRYLRIEERWNVPQRARSLIGAGNVMFIVYLIGRLAASAVPGGGAGFVFAAIGSLILAVPGYLCLLAGLVIAIAKRTAVPDRPTGGMRAGLTIGAAEGLGLIVVAAVPVAAALWLYAGADSPFRIAREAGYLFERRCVEAGETIRRRAESVRGLYIEKDDVFALSGLREGVYSSLSFGSMGKALQGGGLIEFYERPRPADARNSTGTGRYLRYARGAKEPLVVAELASDYTLSWRDIASPAERALEISGHEYALVERTTGERFANAVFFISGHHRKVCGHPEGHSYSAFDFVKRAIAAPPPTPAAR